jgi:hypothetical protein
MSSRTMTAGANSARITRAHIMRAHVVARLVSLAAGLRATFRQSRTRLCRRLAHHGL